MSTIKLTASQQRFQQVLTRETGLNSKVVGAWMLAEMGGANSSAAQKRDAAKNYNWLNIGYFDSGPGAITKDQTFSDPTRAAKATAQFLKGEKFGASSGIRRILSTTGKDPMAQINAIATSGWASSGYNGGANLRTLYQQAPAASGAASTPSSLGGLASSRTGARTQTSTTVTSNAAAVNAANEENGRRAIVLGLISKHRPNSLLATSGALGPKAVPKLETMASTRVTKTLGTPGATQQKVAGAATPGGGKGAQAALAWAKSTIGVAETTGANRGPRVDQWEQRFGLSAQPWCAMFTSLAATKGGMAKTGRTPSVREVRAQTTNGSAAYQRGFVPGKQAKAGDLILFGNDHIGMVESVGPNGITMIAGNDSNKVQRRTVAFGSGDIVRPKYGR